MVDPSYLLVSDNQGPFPRHVNQYEDHHKPINWKAVILSLNEQGRKEPRPAIPCFCLHCCSYFLSHKSKDCVLLYLQRRLEQHKSHYCYQLTTAQLFYGHIYKLPKFFTKYKFVPSVQRYCPPFPETDSVFVFVPAVAIFLILDVSATLWKYNSEPAVVK